MLGLSLMISATAALSIPQKAIADEMPAQPKLLRPILISKTSAKIRWEKTPKADGYRVYSIDNEGKLEKLATTKGGGRASYIATKLKPGTTCTFTVRAYRQKGNGERVFGTADQKGRSLKLAYTSRYAKGHKLFYDANGNLIKDTTGIIGKRKHYYLKVNVQRCVVTAYAWDSKRESYCTPVKSWLCSPSNYTASGTWHASDKHRFWTLFYNSYSQWTMKIHGNILFHTVPYKSYGSKTALNVNEYNKLGTPASHGCVRMPCDGVKWIYDNCPNGTKVTIYRSNDPGPLGKPKLEKLPKWHSWDPTDPTCRSLCRKHGCH